MTIAEWTQFAEVVNAIRTAEQRITRTPTRDEIAAELGLSQDSYRSLIMQLSRIACPFIAARSHSLVCFLDLAPGQTNPAVLSSASESQVVNLLAETIEAMPSDENTMLSLFFYEHLELEEIAAITKLDVRNVFYLQSHALFRLRSHLTYKWPTSKRLN